MNFIDDPETSSTAKLGENVPCGYSMSAISAFDHIENKHILHRGKAYLKKVCPSLRKHAKNITDFEKKKMLSLLKLELKPHQEAKVCYVCGKKILKKLSKTINLRKVIHHCHYTGKYRGAAHSTDFKIRCAS